MTAIPKDLDVFSAEQVADVLSVSKRNLETWANNGKLIPDFIHGEVALYSKKQLEQF